MERKLDKLANDLGQIGLKTAVIIVVVMILRFFIMKIWISWDNSDFEQIFNILMVGLSILIVK